MKQLTTHTHAALELDKPDVFGWSLGSGVALELAFNYSSVINRIVIADTTLSGEPLLQPVQAFRGTVGHPQTTGCSPWYTSRPPADLIAPAIHVWCSLVNHSCKESTGYRA